MRLQVLLIGKVKEKYLHAGMSEYLKRLGPYARVDVIQLSDEAVPDRAAPADIARIQAREAERLLRALDPAAYLVALDLRGTQLSSEEFAAFLDQRALQGDSSIAFAIGGSTGLAPAVLQQARLRLSLGPMTFPHQMVPMLLLEQVYRAFRINRREPYHK